MRSTFALGVVVIFALSSLGTPLASSTSAITLPLARRFNVTGTLNIAEADRARAKLLKSRIASNTGRNNKRSVFVAPITNEAVSYSVSVSIKGRLGADDLTCCYRLGLVLLRLHVSLSGPFKVKKRPLTMGACITRHYAC